MASEAILKQKEEENFELNNSQKVELAIFQQLLKNSRLDKKAGWYDVPINKFDGFFQLLAKAEEVLDGKTKEITDNNYSAKPSLSNVACVGNAFSHPRAS